MPGIACRTLLAALAVCVAAPVLAADRYPARPIRLVVPFAPGGGTDISARILAEALSQRLDQTIVVDNRPGAGSILGTEIVSKASPDGYTLLLGNISMAFNAALYKKLPFDALRDFAPISLVTDQPNLLVGSPALPAKDFKAFVALARSQPGKLTYGSAGTGSGTHLAMELLLMSHDMNLVHVPYKGTGPALTAVMGNQISAFFSTFASALPHAKAGRVHAYAVSSDKRARALPDVPTVAESGVPGYRYSTWYGLLAPAGTPAAIVNRLNQATVAALNDPATRKRYDAQGVDVIPSTPKEYVDFLRAETVKWAKVVKAAKIPQQ